MHQVEVVVTFDRESTGTVFDGKSDTGERVWIGCR